MNTQTSASLRVRFAKAMAIEGLYESQLPSFWERIPDPTDANTVREALMGMTEEEWELFSRKVWSSLYGIYSSDSHKATIIAFAKLPPTTLAEIYCGVKNT